MNPQPDTRLDSVRQAPAPRLQLRWEGPTRRRDPAVQFDDDDWLCHYELVLPLGEYDIRREIYKDGEQVGERSELVVPMKGATRRGCTVTPCVNSLDGSLYADTPYRDGAHARWDAALLGDLPIFVVAPCGTLLPVKKDPTPQTQDPNNE